MSEIEQQLQRLICGDLDERARTDLLGRLATDAEARDLLAEAVER